MFSTVLPYIVLICFALYAMQLLDSISFFLMIRTVGVVFQVIIRPVLFGIIFEYSYSYYFFVWRSPRYDRTRRPFYQMMKDVLACCWLWILACHQRCIVNPRCFIRSKINGLLEKFHAKVHAIQKMCLDAFHCCLDLVDRYIVTPIAVVYIATLGIFYLVKCMGILLLLLIQYVWSMWLAMVIIGFDTYNKVIAGSDILCTLVCDIVQSIQFIDQNIPLLLNIYYLSIIRTVVCLPNALSIIFEFEHHLTLDSPYHRHKLHQEQFEQEEQEFNELARLLMAMKI
ncbi:hypothetical protein BCR42DRAFT_391362 [Absidia repens]|uniref:Uncharacterized protein n=1 Tax=Absidia repens TaxID=90262 RepID=A0A1X2IJW2_9FUNG|nr:hypothetical protein BCR42DRAFT_391362 [Absidia repens]